MKTAKQSFNPDSTAVALLDDASKIVADKTLFINRCIAKAGLGCVGVNTSGTVRQVGYAREWFT